MNMETEDIYPISSTITKCSIDDFWLHIDHEQENNRDTVYLVYNSQSNKKKKVSWENEI